MSKSLLLGSFVEMNGKNNFLIGSVNQAISEGANTFMIFTGAPQSSFRTDVDELNIPEFKKICKANNFMPQQLVVHAPYIINLANSVNPNTLEFSRSFFKSEIERVVAIGLEIIVLHPGAYVGGNRQDALNTLINSLDEVLFEFANTKIKIALETMSGKGTQICASFEDIAYVLKNVKFKEHVGVCFDTCHLWDYGYDIKKSFDEVLEKFDQTVGIDKLWAVHLNDSKNERGNKKDRHDNIGYGMIGYEALLQIVHHEQLSNIPIILETPFFNDNPTFESEIKMLRNKKFLDFRK